MGYSALVDIDETDLETVEPLSMVHQTELNTVHVFVDTINRQPDTVNRCILVEYLHRIIQSNLEMFDVLCERKRWGGLLPL